MHKDNAHPDRTLKQPVTFRCQNPECAENGQYFEFDGTDDKCPRCTSSGPPFVIVLTLVHLLIGNPNGKILGYGGKRFSMACDFSRESLATFTNKEAATSEGASVTCPGCKSEMLRMRAPKTAPGSQPLTPFMLVTK